VVPEILINAPLGVTVMEWDTTRAISVTLTLSFLPDADVVVSVTVSDQIALTGPSELTFTPSGWNVGQSITVVARDDWIREGSHSGLVTTTVSSSDGRFDGIAVDPVTVMIEDNDCDALEAPTHGQLLPGCGSEYGDICTVQCDAGRAPEVGVEVECLSSTGDWDQARPTCEACAQGYFKPDSSTCVACSTLECGVGSYRGACGVNSDAACEGCTSKPLHSSYTTSGKPWDTDNCAWTCDDRYWRSGES
jgi:hypothetical protein